MALSLAVLWAASGCDEPALECDLNRGCPTGFRCVSGHCEVREGLDAAAFDGAGLCPPPSVDCDGVCVDTRSDVLHCGGCGQECTDAPCVAGSCCPEPLAACSAGCHDTMVDPNHCGRCDNVSEADEYCVSGTCQCRPGRSLAPAEGCVDTESHVLHCGALDNACDPTYRCKDGSCTDGGCGRGKIDCGGHCVREKEDPMNCGGCGIRCEVDQVCADGECVVYRPAPVCTECPCPACPTEACCTYPNTEHMICVVGDRCPR